MAEDNPFKTAAPPPRTPMDEDATKSAIKYLESSGIPTDEETKKILEKDAVFFGKNVILSNTGQNGFRLLYVQLLRDLVDDMRRLGCPNMERFFLSKMLNALALYRTQGKDRDRVLVAGTRTEEYKETRDLTQNPAVSKGTFSLGNIFGGGHK